MVTSLTRPLRCRRTARAWFPVMLTWLAMPVAPGFGQKDDGKPTPQVQPLAAKQEMIHDRFQRFEDRVYRLRDLLADAEPDNATRLARVLERGGELGLGDRLTELIELLREPSSLNHAFDAHADWLVDAERLLDILLERDSGNLQRKSEIDRLQQYLEQLGQILTQQRALRSDTADAGSTRGLIEQLSEALRRIEALLNRQQGLSKEA